MVGQVLKSRFRIIKSLGAGAFGETFLAEDTQKMNAQCVVKRLIPPSDPAHITIVQQMFYREAKKLDALNHQGIPKLIAYFEDGGDFYLVQDFVDGQTLDCEINPSEKWTESRVKRFLLEILEILAYVHNQGSIHRDLKPNNMMRRRANDKLVLIDFGAGREVRQTSSNMAIGLASGTIMIGTYGYMPAEQAQGRPCYASDVYAVGCIVIEALIGVSPCPDGFDMDVKTGEIRWRHRVRVSDELAAIIDKMVRYDWRARYANAGEALAALQPVPIISKPIPKPPKTLLVTPKTPHANPTWRRFLTVAGLAGASAVSIVSWEIFKPRGQEITVSPLPTSQPQTSKTSVLVIPRRSVEPTTKPVETAASPTKPSSSSNRPSSNPTEASDNKSNTNAANLAKIAGEYMVVLDLKVLADAEKEGVKSVTGKWIIRANGTFEATLKAVSIKDEVQEIKTAGKITIEDGKVVSQVEFVNGERPTQIPPKQPYTLSSDSKVLQADGQPVKLVKL